jgi:hypothetical protein
MILHPDDQMLDTACIATDRCVGTLFGISERTDVQLWGNERES